MRVARRLGRMASSRGAADVRPKPGSGCQPCTWARDGS